MNFRPCNFAAVPRTRHLGTSPPISLPASRLHNLRAIRLPSAVPFLVLPSPRASQPRRSPVHTQFYDFSVQRQLYDTHGTRHTALGDLHELELPAHLSEPEPRPPPPRHRPTENLLPLLWTRIPSFPFFEISLASPRLFEATRFLDIWELLPLRYLPLPFLT